MLFLLDGYFLMTGDFKMLLFWNVHIWGRKSAIRGHIAPVPLSLLEGQLHFLNVAETSGPEALLTWVHQKLGRLSSSWRKCQSVIFLKFIFPVAGGYPWTENLVTECRIQLVNPFSFNWGVIKGAQVTAVGGGAACWPPEPDSTPEACVSWTRGGASSLAGSPLSCWAALMTHKCFECVHFMMFVFLYGQPCTGV